MRRSKFWLSSVFVALLLLVCSTTGSKAQGRYAASYQDFYDDLAPYGQWIQDPQYGYVWLPDVEPDFRPYYTNGYWANTQYGNTWVSGYDWGWAPFHYGRWTYDSYYGWLWIPDTEWAPAWVSWRSSNDYYGWAPMGPGININVNLGLIPVDWWVFITPGYFYDRSFYRYCNNDYRFRRGIYSRTNIINYTYIDNRTTYYTGPRANDYYKHTGRRPSMFNIDNNSRRGATRVKGDRISIYRPDVRNTSGAPARVASTDRAITRRPQIFNGTAEGARGRQMVLGESRQNAAQPGRTQRLNDVSAPPANQRIPGRDQSNIRVQQQNNQLQRSQQNNAQLEQQRTQQVQQREMQMQRNAQQEQQREIQMQQRNTQMEQQRTQQREMQMQRNAQMEQQRTQQAQQREMQMQRNAQMEQQRTQQAQQREMQMQRNAQMEQQRAQQAQQREMQMQQRNTQMEQQQRGMQQQREMQRSRMENNSQPAQQKPRLR